MGGSKSKQQIHQKNGSEFKTPNDHVDLTKRKKGEKNDPQSRYALSNDVEDKEQHENGFSDHAAVSKNSAHVLTDIGQFDVDRSPINLPVEKPTVKVITETYEEEGVDAKAMDAMDAGDLLKSYSLKTKAGVKGTSKNLVMSSSVPLERSLADKVGWLKDEINPEELLTKSWSNKFERP